MTTKAPAKKKSSKKPKYEIMESDDGSFIIKLPLEAIVVNEDENQRTDYGAIDDLAEQIDEMGLMQPPGVVRTGKGAHISYELAYGFRRMRAIAQLIEQGRDNGRFDTILCKMVKDPSDQERKLANLIENLGRKSLSMSEVGAGVATLRDEFKMTRSEIEHYLGKSAQYVQNALQVNDKATDKVKDANKAGDVKDSDTIELARTEPEAQDEAVESITSGNKKPKDAIDDAREKSGMADKLRRPTQKQIAAYITEYNYIGRSKEDAACKAILATIAVMMGLKDKKTGELYDIEALMDKPRVLAGFFKKHFPED